MLRKIKLIFRAYFSTLNMSPAVEEIVKKRFISRKDSKETSIWIHILLFVVTIATTTFAGISSGDTLVEMIISGLPFSITIMLILLSHEMGHYLAARHFGVKATLPFFIPFPSIIGTMGAVIKIKSPINDKRALLYIGALGPIVGFTLSLIASIIGIYLSDIKPLPDTIGNGLVPIFGDSLIFATITKIIHGDIPAGHDIFLSPYAWAGWIGMLVTSLNLMPMGQLDGSHIVYALIKRKQLIFGWITFSGLILLSFFWLGWIVWIIMVLLFLMIGHPNIDDDRNLSTGEKMIGWSCVVMFVITFIPVPVQLI